MRSYSLPRFALAVIATSACSSSYHPEYHPVTISHISQNLSYPVTVHSSGDPATRSPVIIAPAPPLAAVPAPPPGQPPPLPPAEWFRGY